MHIRNNITVSKQESIQNPMEQIIRYWQGKKMLQKKRGNKNRPNLLWLKMKDLLCLG